MLQLSPEEWTAVALSLRVAAVATVVALPIGIAVAWILARKEFPGKPLLNAVIYLPLVLPPVVTGYLLLIRLWPPRLVRSMARRCRYRLLVPLDPARRWLAA